MIQVIRLLTLIIFLPLFLSANIEFTKEEYDYIKNNKVKVAMLPDFPPFSIYEGGKHKGFSYDILQLIAKKSGLQLEYKVDNWPVNLQKFKEKKVDIIDSISFRENRLQFTYYTKPYYEIPLVIFSRKDLKSYAGLESLKGKKLGITKNIFYKQQIKDLGIFELVEYESFQDKLKGLAFGEVDVIFGHLLSTQIAIKKSQYTNMKVLDELNLPNLNKTDLRFGITKGNENLYNIVNKTFNSITKIEWDLLYEKWISTYTKAKGISSKSIIDLSQKEKNFLLSKKINCVTDIWPPFIMKDGDRLSGIAIEFWDLIKKKTLIQSECKLIDDFPKILDMVKNKEADVIISTAITEDKLSYGRFSIPYVSYPIAMATTLDKRYITDIQILNGKKVGVGKSYSASNLLKQKYPEIELIEFKDNLEALKALSRGEVYAVVDILPVLSHIISEYGFKDIKISGKTDFNFYVRVMVRDDYEELVSIVNKGIISISKAESQKIKNSWISVKYENIVDYTTLWQIGIIVLFILLVLIYRQYILNNHNKKLKEANNEIELKTLELENKTRQLQEQKELFERLFIESSDGVLLSKFQSNKVHNCNEVAYKLLGYEKKEEFLTLRPEDVVPLTQPDGSFSLEIIGKKINDAVKNGSSHFELVYRKKDGLNIWLDVVITSLLVDDENLLHIVWRDIDNRKKMEEKLGFLTYRLEEKVKLEVEKNAEKTKQLVQQSRLAQMGEMISMIAHQWRQPLTAISATTNNLLIRMMLDEKITSDELREEINLISNYSQHLSMTIDDFRNFFKSDKNKVQTTLENIVNNSISIVKSSIDSNGITLEINFNCNKYLNLFATEINQVVLNLIKNAEDAIVENLVINSKIEIKTYIENSNAVLEIIDNAGGVPEDIMDKIFDPYFSTKKTKEGTGLGLYMSKIIINDHCNGNLSVQNYENGAIFKVEIPFE